MYLFIVFITTFVTIFTFRNLYTVKREDFNGVLKIVKNKKISIPLYMYIAYILLMFIPIVNIVITIFYFFYLVYGINNDVLMFSSKHIDYFKNSKIGKFLNRKI